MFGSILAAVCSAKRSCNPWLELLSRCDGQVLGVNAIDFIEAFAVSDEAQQRVPYAEVDSLRQRVPYDVREDEKLSGVSRGMCR